MIISGDYKNHIQRRIETLKKMYYAGGLLFLFLILSEFLRYSHLSGYSFLLILKALWGIFCLVYVFLGNDFSGNINLLSVFFSIALGAQLEVFLPESISIDFDYVTFKTSIIIISILGLTGISYFYGIALIIYVQFVYFLIIYSQGVFYYSYFFTIISIFIGITLNSIVRDQYDDENKLIDLVNYWKDYSSQLISEKIPKDYHIQNATTLYLDITGIYNYYYANQSLKTLREFLKSFYSNFEEQRKEYKINKFDDNKGHFWFVVFENPSNSDDTYADVLGDFALEIKAKFYKLCIEQGLDFNIRMGMSSGKYIDFQFDEKNSLLKVFKSNKLFEVAKIMEKEGINGEIQLSHDTYQLLKKNYSLSRRPYTSSEPSVEGVYILENKKGNY
jgi:hypothetical protein